MAMITQEDTKNLLTLREQIENCLFEKLSNDEEATKIAKEMLTSASLILQKAKNIEELIAIYDIIAIRLSFFGYTYISFNETNLGKALDKISLCLYDCIDAYLPDNINESEITKSIWPYDVNDIDSVRHALSEYIFNNVFIFGPGYLFVHDFISKYENKIKEAKSPREVMEVYDEIRLDAWLHSLRYSAEGDRHQALKYEVLSDILRFMIFDFRDLLQSKINQYK
jgi:hypothetical protein